MLDHILFFSHCDKVRQLYHEVLSTPKCEIIPASDATTALLFLSINSFLSMVIYTTDAREIDIAALLRLRKRQQTLQKTRCILVTDTPDLYHDMVLPEDTILGIEDIDEMTIQGLIKAQVCP